MGATEIQNENGNEKWEMCVMLYSRRAREKQQNTYTYLPTRNLESCNRETWDDRSISFKLEVWKLDGCNALTTANP